MTAKAIPERIPAMAALEAGAKVTPYEYPVKPLSKNDVDFHVTFNGVCATDLHMINNAWGMSRFPLVPGHEVIGKVLAVGSEVKGIKVGDTVGLGCYAQTCGKCNWCTSGRDNICRERRFTYFGNTVDETGEHVHHGGFSSFIRTDYRGLFHIPEGIPESHAGPLLCAGITVAAPLHDFCGHSFNGKGKTIAVVGLGGLGHLAVQFIAKMGAEAVVVSRGTDKKAFASELGATRYIDSTNKDEMKAAEGTLDMLLVCTSGASFDVGAYVGLLRPYGHLHFCGVPDGDLKFNIMPFIFNRLTLSGNPAGSSDQMRAMLDFAAKNGIKPIIEIFPHSKANEALQKIRDNTIRFRAVLQNDIA